MCVHYLLDMEGPSQMLCIFIIRATHSLCLCLTLSLSITLADSLFVYFSLCDKLASPACLLFSIFPLPFSIHLLSLFVSFCFHASPLSPSEAPLSSSSLCLLLCLAHFRRHPPPSCFLLCVCCLFRLTLLLQ